MVSLEGSMYTVVQTIVLEGPALETIHLTLERKRWYVHFVALTSYTVNRLVTNKQSDKLTTVIYPSCACAPSVNDGIMTTFTSGILWIRASGLEGGNNNFPANLKSSSYSHRLLYQPPRVSSSSLVNCH